jgi:lysophospholipase L1-like esterase
MKKYFIIVYMILVLFALTLISSSATHNEVKVVAVGDSITFGTGDPLKKGYVGRIEDLLEESNGTNIIMSNFGIPRYTTDDTLMQLKGGKIQKEIKEANFILLYIGTNDFRKSAQYRFDQLNLEKMKAGRARFSKNLHKILDIIRSYNGTAPIFVMGLYHPYTQYKNENQIYKTIMEWNREINDVVTPYEAIAYVPTIDLFLGKPKRTCFSDSLHLNATGYDLVANRLFNRMELFNDTK